MSEANLESGEKWPFDQPRNCATITMRQVMNRSEPILLVSHDADDHGWQFVGSTEPNMDDAMIVGLSEIVAIDSTVLDVANLPPGWQALRTKHGGVWNRQLQPVDPSKTIS